MSPLPSRPDPAVLAAICVGGGTGSLVRFELSELVHNRAGTVPWTTLGINLSGSLLLGMLIVAVTEIWRPHHLLRPLFGTGVLGGFTTFSTFAVESRGLPAGLATTYVLLSVVGGVAAAALGMSVVRRLEPRVHIAATHELVDPIDPDLP